MSLARSIRFKSSPASTQFTRCSLRNSSFLLNGPAAGIVLLDAGQLVFDADDNLVHAPGRHPQFFGASFCDALVPTG